MEVGAEGDFAVNRDVKRGRPDLRTFRVRVALDDADAEAPARHDRRGRAGRCGPRDAHRVGGAQVSAAAHRLAEPPPVDAAEAIVTRGIVKRFGDFTAVDGVDLDGREGELFGLLGPNGAGKTTLVRMLTGLVPDHARARRSSPAGRRARPDRRPATRSAWCRRRSPRTSISPAGRTSTSTRASSSVPRAARHAAHRGAPAPGRAVGSARRPGQDLLGRHAAAAGDRARADPQAARAVPRRADHRPRPAEPARHLGPAHRPAQGRRTSPSRSPPTTSTRPRSLCDRVAIVDRGKIVALGTPAELKALVPGSDTLELTLERGRRPTAPSTQPRALAGVRRVERDGVRLSTCA